MSDVYTPYETGLRALLERLGHDHPRYSDALVYQQRLTENIKAARRYGDTASRRAERAEVVDRLNALALEALGVSYSALCQETSSAMDTVPDENEGQPLALIASALEARRLLLVWADAPFPPQERPTAPAALLINRWQEAAASLPGTPFDFAHGHPWPLTGLPPLTILSLDPSDRLERAFRYAGVPLNVVCAQEDVTVRTQHNLLKLGGDLDSRTGLLLTWDAVREAANDPDKAHLLREARRVARDGVALALAPSPDDVLARLWRELVGPALRGTAHQFVLGQAGFNWPEPLTRLDGEAEEVLSALADVVVPPPLEPVDADTESLRRQLTEARGNLRLIEERKSEFVLSTDVPLQLVKEERHLRERIAELERRLGLGEYAI